MGDAHRWRLAAGLRTRLLIASVALLSVGGLPLASLRPSAEAAPVPSTRNVPASNVLDVGAPLDDEFDGPAGAAPSSSMWQIQTGGGRWGGGQLQDYTASADNVSLDGEGHLVITARREPSNGYDYTSGRIASVLPMATYGHFEARIKMPLGNGLWPCFWIMGVEPNGLAWPYSGEIDIAEMASKLPSIQFATVHGPRVIDPSTPQNRHWFFTYILRYGKPLPYAFHTFAVDTSPGQIVWSMDGKPYFSVRANQVPLGGFWPFDAVRYYVILNLAVGGQFPTDPTPATKFPASMIVDYVRVMPS